MSEKENALLCYFHFPYTWWLHSQLPDLNGVSLYDMVMLRFVTETLRWVPVEKEGKCLHADAAGCMEEVEVEEQHVLIAPRLACHQDHNISTNDFCMLHTQAGEKKESLKQRTDYIKTETKTQDIIRWWSEDDVQEILFKYKTKKNNWRGG